MNLILDDINDYYAPSKAVGESTPALRELLCRRELEETILDQHVHGSEKSVCVARMPYYFFPTAVLGILANLVVLWVWSSEPGYHPTSYLFKAQALTDSLVILSALVRQFISGILMEDIVIYSVLRAFVYLAVQVTMLLAVSRVIKVFFCLRSHKLLSRFRMNLVLAGLAVFNLTITHLSSYWRIAFEAHWYRTYLVAVPAVTVFIPAALQIVLMIAVTWRVWRSFRIKPISTLSRLAVSFQEDKHKTRRLVYTVFVMCVFTFIAYFVPSTALLLVSRSTYRLSHMLAFIQIIKVACLINLSINIVLYYFFIVKFKGLLHKKIRTIRQQLTSLSFFRFSSSTESTVSERHNMTTHPGDSVITPPTPPRGLKEGSGSSNTYIT